MPDEYGNLTYEEALAEDEIAPLPTKELIDARVRHLRAAARQMVDAHPEITQQRRYLSEVALSKGLVAIRPKERDELPLSREIWEDTVRNAKSSEPRFELNDPRPVPLDESGQRALANYLRFVQAKDLEGAATYAEMVLAEAARSGPVRLTALAALRPALRAADWHGHEEEEFRVHWVGQEADRLLKPLREHVVERADKVMGLLEYQLGRVREALEKFGAWNHPENVSAHAKNLLGYGILERDVMEPEPEEGSA